MKQLNDTVNLIAAEMGIGPDEISRRMDILELSVADMALLRTLHEDLNQARTTFVDDFYNHLLTFDETRALIADDAVLVRQKQSRSAYFNILTSGEYGMGYVLNRLRVGVVHRRVGLKLKWYIGAYRKYLSCLLPQIWKLTEGDSAKCMAAYDALLNIVIFDIGLVLDTYIHADHQAIVELKEYAEQIVNTMPSGLVVLDESLNIRSANRAFRRMFSLEQADLSGQPVDVYFPSAMLRERLHSLVATGRREYDVMIEVALDGGGRYFEIDISTTLLEQEHALLLMVQDITGRRRAEEETCTLNAELEQRVLERTAQLEAANNELEAFSYSVSHDLRAPLRSIDGFSQALLEDYGANLDVTGKDYLQRVRAATQHMGQLIDDMPGLARINRGELRREEVGLSVLFHALGGRRR